MQRKDGDLGISGHDLPLLGGTREFPVRHGGVGPAVPGCAAPGAPDRDQASSGHGKELGEGCTGPGQDLPRCKVSAQSGGQEQMWDRDPHKTLLSSPWVPSGLPWRDIPGHL